MLIFTKRREMAKKIAIIGGGNLGASIADGLILSEFSRPVELSITRRNLSLKPVTKLTGQWLTR